MFDCKRIRLTFAVFNCIEIDRIGNTNSKEMCPKGGRPLLTHKCNDCMITCRDGTIKGQLTQSNSKLAYHMFLQTLQVIGMVKMSGRAARV